MTNNRRTRERARARKVRGWLEQRLAMAARRAEAGHAMKCQPVMAAQSNRDQQQ